jgi:hypothetical protein
MPGGACPSISFKGCDFSSLYRRRRHARCVGIKGYTVSDVCNVLCALGSESPSRDDASPFLRNFLQPAPVISVQNDDSYRRVSCQRPLPAHNDFGAETKAPMLLPARYLLDKKRACPELSLRTLIETLQFGKGNDEEGDAFRGASEGRAGRQDIEPMVGPARS